MLSRGNTAAGAVGSSKETTSVNFSAWGIPTIGLGCLDDPDAPKLGLDQTHDLFGPQPFDFRCPEPERCQNGSTVLADARRRASDLGRGAIEARRGFVLADEPDVRMVQFDDELSRHYLLVGDHLIAPQHWR